MFQVPLWQKTSGLMTSIRAGDGKDKLIAGI
jgi:hypothetical protein